MKIELLIEGIPVAWKGHGGHGRRTFNKRYAERDAYRWHLKKQYLAEPIDRPIILTVSYEVPIPSSASKKKQRMMLEGILLPVKRPDLSNYTKFLEDCMTGIVYVDDSLIVEQHVSKTYSRSPQTVITIEDI